MKWLQMLWWKEQSSFLRNMGKTLRRMNFVLDGICYTTKGQEQTVLFAEEGIETTGYTVGIAS